MEDSLEALEQAIERLQNQHQRLLDTRLAPLRITLVQWEALRAIEQHPDASSHVLAQLTFQTDQSFGALAHRLMARRWIKRSAHGRALHHQLTPAGEAVLQAGHAIVNETLAAAFAPLSPSERALLHKLLTPLLQQ